MKKTFIFITGCLLLVMMVFALPPPPPPTPGGFGSDETGDTASLQDGKSSPSSEQTFFTDKEITTTEETAAKTVIPPSVPVPALDNLAQRVSALEQRSVFFSAPYIFLLVVITVLLGMVIYLFMARNGTSFPSSKVASAPQQSGIAQSYSLSEGLSVQEQQGQDDLGSETGRALP